MHDCGSEILGYDLKILVAPDAHLLKICQKCISLTSKYFPVKSIVLCKFKMPPWCKPAFSVVVGTFST